MHQRDRPEGRDRVLLSIAGAGGSADVWPASLLEALDGAALAIDLPGHGQNARPGRRRSDDYAQYLAAHILTLSAPQVVLIGHSMGAAIALAVAYRHPELVANLVLIGSAARLRVAPALFHQLTTDFAAATQFMAQYGYAPSADPALPSACTDQLRQTGSLVTTGDFLACSQFDARPWLADITCHALVISGEADKLVRPSEAAALAAALPNGRFVTVPEAGHFVMQEKPEAVAAEINVFLAEA